MFRPHFETVRRRKKKEIRVVFSVTNMSENSREYFIQGVHDNYLLEKPRTIKNNKRTNYRTQLKVSDYRRGVHLCQRNGTGHDQRFFKERIRSRGWRRNSKSFPFITSHHRPHSLSPSIIHRFSESPSSVSRIYVPG